VKLYRPATVIVGIVFVLLGGLTRLVDTDQVYDDSSRTTVHGTIGEQLKFGDSTFTVTRMRFAKKFLEHEDDDETIETDGVFVAVEYDAARGRVDPGSNDASLTTDGDSVYVPVSQVTSDGITFPEPGFAESGAWIFEVNPSDLKGLTLKIHTVQFFTGVPARDMAVDLAIPSEDIAKQLVDQAADQYVLPDKVTRVAS
jgi:hypothetical protein